MREFLKKKVLLVEDNAGWHRSNSAQIPDGIIVEFLPAYSPELQPAERLWTLVDEPLVNEYFETIEELEEVLVLRCNGRRRHIQRFLNLTRLSVVILWFPLIQEIVSRRMKSGKQLIIAME